MEIDHPLLGKFKIVKQIGEGSFATVFLAQNLNHHYPVALKMFQDKNEEKYISETYNITRSIMHPFICQDYDLMKTPQGSNILFMEYIDGKTLLEYANENSPLPIEEIQNIFGQLIIAIDFLHKNHIIHRDLKCENIMIDKNKNIRLIDLSFSCNNANMHSTICGSPGYIAPEMIKNGQYSESIDIWSLGVIIYAITYGKLPFYHQNLSALNRIITSIEPFYPSEERVSFHLVDLIKKMLKKNPKNRITIDAIKSHPFFCFDSSGNRFIFNDSQINYFVRIPYSQMIPETQVIQQMNLPVNESIKAINEIKLGKKSHYSMTYNILYKNFVSNIQLKYYAKSFLNPINESIKEIKTENALPLMIDIKNIQKSNDAYKTERVNKDLNFETANLQLTESPNSSRENFNINMKQQSGMQFILNEKVHFRRFSSIGKPFGATIIKRNLLNNPLQQKKNVNFSNANFQKESVSLKALPQLMTQKEK